MVEPRFLLFASLMLGTTVLIHSAGTTLLVQWFERRASRADRPRRWYGRPLALVTTALTLMLLHIVEMVVWALVYWDRPELPEVFESFDDALYFSAVTYTTLGYGDITIDRDPWRLLCGLEALNGILLAGWSTAMLFLVVQHLWEFDQRRSRELPPGAG